MKLLKCIYSGPVQVLEKAKRDRASLTEALDRGHESGVRESLFNFVVTTYHIVDWVKSYRADLKGEVYAHLNQCEALRACRDLCNASKHVQLSLEHRSYRERPPVVEDVAVSAATVATTLVSVDDPLRGLTENQAVPFPSPPWRLKVQLTSGRRLRAEIPSG